MGIVTKRGDNSQTDLCGGMRVAKDHIIIETLGVLDELSAYLGLAKSFLKRKTTKNIIECIQRDLFSLGAEIAACAKTKFGRAPPNYLEQNIARLEQSIKPKKCRFHLPGGNLTSSHLDVARTICRKLERRAITLNRKKMLSNKNILIYLNRLSDLLCLLVRAQEK